MADAPRSRMAERRRKIALKHQRLKLLVMSTFIATISLIFYAGFNFIDDSSNPIEKSTNISIANSIDNSTLNKNNGNRTNIMLMGVDERNEDVGRSDTLMLMSINNDQDSASLLSIPRDTRVKIKRHGYDKINAAYAYGGEQLSQSTVESFLGIDIDHYIIVNTHSFVKVIDALGGIDINVEKRMQYEDPWDDDGGLVIDLKPGLQHMDGKTAVTYVRYRDEEGDAGRVRRLMRACLDKLSSPSMIIKLPEIFNEVRTAINTDLSIPQMLEFASVLKSADENLKTGIVPGHWLYINGVSYLVPNIERLEEVVTINLGIDNAKIEEHFEQIAYEYEDSLPYYDEVKNSYMYDENVNENKDRKLIDYLNDIDFVLSSDNDV